MELAGALGRIGVRASVMVLTLLATVEVGATGAAAEKKLPWEWTTAERAAARRDPAKRLERVRSSNARKSARGRSQPPFDVIGGAHPELFFVTELFEILVRFGLVMLPENYRHTVAQRSSDLFRNNPAEWDRFADIAQEYAEVLKKETSAATAQDKQAVTALQSAKCAAAAKALRESRKVFGQKRFDRMLYEMATFERSYGWDTDIEKSLTTALSREELCQ